MAIQGCGAAPKSDSEDHTETADTLFSQATVYFEEEKYADANTVYQKALERFKTEYGESDDRVFRCYDRLAATAYALKQFNKMAEYATAALSIRPQRTWG